MSNPKDPGKDYEIIFRRFITKNGKKLDAHKYGKRAWPIKVKVGNNS